VKGQPAEVLAQRKQDIADIRSTYYGADPIFDAINQAQVQEMKLKARNVLSADEAKAREQQELREHADLQQNATNATTAANNQSAINAAEKSRRRDLSAEYEDERNKLREQWMNAVVKETEGVTGYADKTKDNCNAVMQRLNYMKLNAEDTVQETKIQGEIDDIKANGCGNYQYSSTEPFILKLFNKGTQSKKHGGKLIAKS
jgi:uncharacterized protein with von Willebrand factor type A (vWA) domain